MPQIGEAHELGDDARHLDLRAPKGNAGTCSRWNAMHLDVIDFATHERREIARAKLATTERAAISDERTGDTTQPKHLPTLRARLIQRP